MLRSVSALWPKAALILLVLGFAQGCSDSEESDGSSNVSSEGGVTGKLMLQPEMEAPVKDNSPRNYQVGFELANLRLKGDQAGLLDLMDQYGLTDNLASACNDLYTRETTQWYSCRAAMNVKEDFFISEGPMNIAKLLTIIDSRMADIFRNTDWSYMPCFDPENTEGGTYTEEGEEKTYPAFSGFEFGPTLTFADNTTFTLNFTATLSCYSQVSAPEGSAWVAFGRKDGTYYIYEGQTSGTGALSSVNKDGDIEMYMGVGKALDDFPDTVAKQMAQKASFDTGIIHLKSSAATGRMEITVGGMGATACKTHLITDGISLYVETNTNTYGGCFASDTFIGETSHDEVIAYDATKIGQQFCLDVSDKTAVTAYDSLAPCTDVGLDSSGFALTTLDRATFKGHYGPYFFNRDLASDVAQVEFVPINSDDLVGTDTNIMNFTGPSTDTVNLSTTCSGGTTEAIDLTHTLDMTAALQEMVDEMQSSTSNSGGESAAGITADNGSESGNSSNSFVEADFREHVVKGLQGGSPIAKFTLAGSASGIKWSDIDVAVSVKLDDVEIATGTYTESEDRAVGGQPMELTLDLANLTEASILTITTKGTLGLGCAASSGSGSASFKLGLPRVSYTAFEGASAEEAESRK